ncbi:hypothetical protein AGMMS49579_26410 [Spirochaetia bacterium]|nr:hypothetical protein AGMMS49579_26410 [Spirochaetia bacterium]
MISRMICIRKYQECRFEIYWNKNLFKEITSYTGWNLFGASVGIFKNQIINILLNQFFNPGVVAARAIASSINNAVASFSINFGVAIRPQIVKSYAAGQREEMLRTVFYGAKGTYFLMFFFTLPIIIEMPGVLSLWLKTPPENVVLFARLILLDALIDSVNNPIMAAAQATGKIKLYQSSVGGILLLNLPVSWIALLLGAPVYSVFLVSIFFTFVASIIRLFMLRRLIDFSILEFFAKVLIPVASVSLVAIILPLIVFRLSSFNIYRLLITVLLCSASIIGCIFLFGLTSQEKQFLKSVIKK